MKVLLNESLKLLAMAEKGSGVVAEVIATCHIIVEKDPSAGPEMAARLARTVRRGAPDQQHNAWLAILAMEDRLGPESSTDFATEAVTLRKEGYTLGGGRKKQSGRFWLLW